MNFGLCLIGAKDTTIRIAEYMLEHISKPDCIITVDEAAVNTDAIAGFSSIEAFARRNGIGLYKVKNYSMADAGSRRFFTQNSFGIGICAGWQRLIPQYVLDAFQAGIFGFHGSCAYLPFGRGRSPMNWSIIKGDRRFILNMFRYDAKADSPNVFERRMFEINEHDTIRILQYKSLLCSCEMAGELWKAYKKGPVPINTDTKDPDSLYPKRTPQDGKISFTARTAEIYDLIRGVTRPFPGAFALIEGTDVSVRIWDAVPFDSILDFSGYRVGEIIEVFDGHPIVRTLDGSLIIRDYECSAALQKGLVLV